VLKERSFLDAAHSFRSEPRRKERSTVEVALLIPLSGSAGLFGPSCESCAELAKEEINETGGMLGRRVNLVPVDAAGPVRRVVRDIDTMVKDGVVDAVVGWQTSNVRQAIAPWVTRRVPYVYTALYEGGERTPGVFLTGEVPDRQVGPAIRWMAQAGGFQHWCMVGNDYIWPRSSGAQARRYITECGAKVDDEVYVPLGTKEFSPILDRLERFRPEVTLTLLVGTDAVEFNRAFAERGLDGQSMRLSPLMDENMLAATGVEGTRGISSSAGFFDSMLTSSNLDFRVAYECRFGPSAPTLNSHGESCYEGIKLLSALAKRAGSLQVRDVTAVAEGVVYRAARGELTVRNSHVDQPVYLAVANGIEFSIITQL